MSVTEKVVETVVEVELPRIKPERVVMNAAGQVWRDVHVNLPQDLSWQQMMDEPTVWSKVQKNPNVAMMAGDRVVLKNFDQSEEATAVVAGCNFEMVRLVGFRKYSYDARSTEVAASDHLYYCKFDGVGWGVYRKQDDVRMLQNSHSTLGLAKTAMFGLHPVKPGAGS